MQLRESLNLLLEQKGRGKERRMRHAEETTEIQIRKRKLLEHHVTPTTTSASDSLTNWWTERKKQKEFHGPIY